MRGQISLLERVIANCGITGNKKGSPPSPHFFLLNGWLLLEKRYFKKMAELIAFCMSKIRTGLSRFSFVKGNKRKIDITEFSSLF